MAFTARIELKGLFRYWPTMEEGKVSKITGLAPWTGEGAPSMEDVPKVKLHHLAAIWWPRSERSDVPPTAMTVWPLGGMELTFDFDTQEYSGLDVDLDGLRMPYMTQPDGGTEGKLRTLVPEEDEWTGLARLDVEKYVEKPIKEFKPDKGIDDRYTHHLGIRKNEENLMGRVVIDRGKVATDELSSMETHFEPQLGESAYGGYFTNRLAVTIRDTRSIVMRAHNLISGNLTGEVHLATGEEDLLIHIVHLCPEHLMTDCPERLGAMEERDEDFHRLYDLSVGGKDLKEKMRGPNKKKPLTVPISSIDHHGCKPTKCGSLIC